MHVARDTKVDNRYRALKRLGSGGMAEVWCAEDEVLGRRVALKLLGERFAEDDEFRERFKREARAAAGLTHPNIVGIFDRSEWDGTPYIAMELVDGHTLKELVQERGPLSPGRAVDLVEQVLRALGYAHRRGIVHRDVKPQNVILDPEGQAKVADFGIARAGTSEMTETGAIVGTVAYCSPEQAQGQPVDARSDLYSAGVVLYELLTGVVPFDGEAPVSVAIKQVSEPPVPPSQRRPGIPPALEAVVMRALEKDPARRYQSAEEFIRALEAARRAPARQHVVVDQPPGEPWVPAEEEPSGSNWWKWALGLLVLVAVIAGVFLLLEGKRVTVPKVTGHSASYAASTLHDAKLQVAFRNVVSSVVPANEVISQDPVAGERVKENTTVQVEVSAGQGTATVPPVAGLSREDAERALRDAGFNPIVKEASSTTVPAGKTISSDPVQGDTLKKGGTVTLTVSTGPPSVSVPKVTGDTQSEAVAALKKEGLKSKLTQQESTEPAGTVLKQSPPAGTTVQRGATVTLTVAKARPQVPDVTTGNPLYSDAKQTLQEAGFKVSKHERSGSAALVGHVVAQSPQPGTPRSTGATVTVTVGSAPSATPTPKPTASPSPTATNTATPTPSPTDTATPASSPAATPTPTTAP